MAITGRVPLLLLLGMLPVVLRPTTGTVWLWLLLVLVLVLLDWALAPRPASLSFSRRPTGSTRLGGPAESVLVVGNEGPPAFAASCATPGNRAPVPPTTATGCGWDPVTARC